MLKRRLIAMLLCIAMIGSMTVYAVGDDTTCTCGTENDVHAEDCALLAEPETEPEPVCTCNTENDEHTSECALYVAPVTEPEVTEPVIDPDCTCGTTEPSSHAETCPCFEYSVVTCICGAGIGTHDTDCPLYKAPTFFEKIKATASLADFRAVLLAEENRNNVLALTAEEIEGLMAHVNALYAAIEAPTSDDTDTRDEMLETLTYLPAMECPECGLIGEHEADCPRGQAESLGLSKAVLLYNGNTFIADPLLVIGSRGTVLYFLASPNLGGPCYQTRKKANNADGFPACIVIGAADGYAV